MANENPYDSASQETLDDTTGLALRLVPFRWWHILGAGLPFALPFLFNVAYDPIDENWTVKTFGCSCPNLDGTYRAFNANHFNAIVWTIVLCCSAYAWSWLCRRIVLPKPPWGVIVLPVIVVAFICLRHYARGFWL
jgi:hypothetical protein